MAVESEHAVVILTEIFENGVKSDLITLVAGVGGRRIPIHRNILMANSKYFTASLGSNFVEADENEFILDETDDPMLKTLVDSCYTGRIDLTEENVTKYLAIASGVELYLLESKCWRFLADGLSVKNAVETLTIADKYSCHELRQKAFNLVCETFDNLSPTHIDGFDNRMWEAILKRDDVRGEEQFVLDRLLDWFRNDEDERGQHMAELLKLIRLPLISTQYLNDDTIQMIHKKFDSWELLLAENIRRNFMEIPTLYAGTRRHLSIFCSFEHVDGAQTSVKIERYIRALDKFERVGEIELGQRQCFGTILHGQNLYILGGWSMVWLRRLRKRDLPEMNSARGNFLSLLLGKFIYVFGGSDGRGATREEMNSCERFNLETETWKELSPMKIARCNGSAAVLNGYIYVAGGSHLGWKRVEFYDPLNDEWNTLPLLNINQCALFTLRNHLYATNGAWPLERYDPWETRWTMIESSRETKVMASSVVINDNTYVIRTHVFGELKIDDNGVSFLPLCTPNFKGTDYRRYQLHRN